MHSLDPNSLSSETKNKLGIVDFSCAQSRLVLSLYGGQILSFFNIPRSHEYLYLSPYTPTDGVSPLRGGIPICWPWFATQSPSGITGRHGWLRTWYWQLNSVQQKEHSIAIRLQPEPLNQPLIQDLEVALDIECSDHLLLTLTTENHGQQEVYLTQALHSYFRLAEQSTATVTGLPRNHYCHVTKRQQCSTSGELTSALRKGAEIDRIYHPSDAHSQPTIKIEPDNIQVHCSGGDSIVVWNPGKNKGKDMADVKNSADQFICIEAAQTAPVILAPQQRLRLTQLIN